MKKITELIERVILKFIQMQHLPISIFFYKYGLPCTMLVAHREIVIKSKLDRRRNTSSMVRLPHNNALPLILSALLDQLQKYSVHTLANCMRYDRVLLFQLFVYLQQIYLNFVIRQIAQQNNALRQPELTVNFPSSRIIKITLAHFEWSTLIVNLGSTIKPFAIAFCNHKIFPTLLQVGLVDMLDLNAFWREGVSQTQIAGVDNPRRAHDPVRYSSEIFYKVKRGAHLFIGGAGCVSLGVRGIVRKSELIIVRCYYYKSNYLRNQKTQPFQQPTTYIQKQADHNLQTNFSYLFIQLSSFELTICINQQQLLSANHMQQSIDSFSNRGSDIIDLDFFDRPSHFGTNRAISIRSHSTQPNHSRNTTKIGTQQVVNNFYLSLPNSQSVPMLAQNPFNGIMMPQTQSGIGVGIPPSVYISQALQSTSAKQPPASQQKEQKLPRIKRMNIPKTTLIDRKTGEVIETITPNRGLVGSQHIQDKQIIQRINRLLIQGGWGYSSLLGKENRRLGEYPGEKSPRDLDFPSVFALVSQQMKQNFKTHGAELAHLIQCPQKVKLVHDCMTFGLTPNNSRYFIYGIFTLTKNLEPVLLALGFAKDQIVQSQKDDLYYTLMKTFIESNNEQLAQERRQLAAKRKLLGRRIREPQVINDKSFIFPEILFCRADKTMEEAATRIRQQFGINFEIQNSFQYRIQIFKLKFLRHELKKQKQILQQGERILKKILQTNNQKDIDNGISKLNTWNQQFGYRYRKFGLSKHCMLNFQKQYIGFYAYQRYEQPMIKYLTALVISRNGQTLKQFLDNITHQEQSETFKTNENYEDRFGIMKYQPRLRKLVLIVEPRVLTQILEIFNSGNSLKQTKDTQSPVPRYHVGKEKLSKQVAVQFRHQMWKCECGFQAKVGIPCAHLFKVLHKEKGTKYEDYINSRHYKIKLSGAVFIE